MIDQDKIKRIAEKAAKVTLGTGSVSSVTSAPILDSEGHDALRITIILTPGSLDMLKGDQLVDATVEIHDTLQKLGEERFPFVRYASEDELEASAAP